MATIARMVVEIDMNNGGVIRGINQTRSGISGLDKSIAALATRFKSAGATMTAAGRTMTLGITAPIVAIGSLSIKAASDFESSFAGVRKTVDATESEFAKLSQGFRDMAKEIPINVNELNAIGEAAGALGIKKEAIMDFTEVVAKMGVTTDLTSDQAANAFARIANIMGTSQGDFERMGSTIVALGNAGASTESEIVAMALRISGAGKTVGLTEAQVLSFASALSSVGIEAEAGGSSISKVMVEIASQVATGGEKLATFAKVSGMSVSAFSKQWKEDAAGALVTFIEGLGKIQKEGGNVFGTLKELGFEEIRVRDALLRAAGAGDMFRETLVLGNEAWKDNTALSAEATKRFETFQSKLQLAKNRVNDVAISLGAVLLPVALQVLDWLEKGVPWIEKAVKAFADLPGPVKLAAIAAVTLLAVVGPLLMALGFMATGIGTLLPMIGGAIKVVKSLGLVIRGLGMAFGIATAPAWLIVAAIALLVVGLIYAYQHSEKFRNIVDKVFLGLKVIAAESIKFVISLFQMLVMTWLNTAGALVHGAALAFGWVPGVGPKLREADAAFGEFRDSVNEKFNDLKTNIDDWKNKAIADAQAAADGAGKPWPGMTTRTQALFNSMSIQVRSDSQAMASKMISDAGAVESKLYTLGRVTVTPTVNLRDNATAAIASVHRAMANLNGTTAIVHIRQDTGNIGLGRHQGGPVFHAGGMVRRFHSGGLRSDEIPAILQRGEFVIRRAAVRALGTPLLRALNAGIAPRGRMQGTPALAGAAGREGSTSTVVFDFTGADENLINLFRKAVRVRGGNVQVVIGGGGG